MKMKWKGEEYDKPRLEGEENGACLSHDHGIRIFIQMMATTRMTFMEIFLSQSG